MFRVEVDDDDEVEIVATGFHEQGNVEDHERGLPGENPDPTVDLDADGRVDDRVEFCQLSGIGEDDLRKGGAVEFSAFVEDAGPESIDDLVVDRLSSGLQLAGDRVGVDHRAGTRGQHRRNRGFPTADSSRESNQTHWLRGYCVPSNVDAPGDVSWH